MSLVGSLEDLGLGEILQIVTLSGKSGVLTIRSEAGEGRIVFRQGLILGSLLQGGPADLRGLLEARGALAGGELEALEERALSQGVPLASLVVDASELDAKRLDELRREQLEESVLQMFLWSSGEFSFEIHEEGELESDLFLRRGLNAQHLALEGVRRRDEQDALGGSATQAKSDAARVQPEAASEVPDGPSSEGGGLGPGPPPPVVVIDPDLPSLESVKEALASLFPRVHIFQRSELAVARIRQYLGRGETPVVILGTDAPPDPVSGARSATELVGRLRAQVPRMPIALLVDAKPDSSETHSEVAFYDAVLVKPSWSGLEQPSDVAGDPWPTEFQKRVADLGRRASGVGEGSSR